MHFVAIRGNVETRLRKLTDPETIYDALVLARAGLNRLEIEAAYVVLDPELLPPAPGQGALAIQCRAGDRELAELTEPLHDPATAAAVRAERRLMVDLEGGCRLPIGALRADRAPTASCISWAVSRTTTAHSVWRTTWVSSAAPRSWPTASRIVCGTRAPESNGEWVYA